MQRVNELMGSKCRELTKIAVEKENENAEILLLLDEYTQKINEK